MLRISWMEKNVKNIDGDENTEMGICRKFKQLGNQ